FLFCFFFSSRRRHTRFSRDWSSDVCSSDLAYRPAIEQGAAVAVMPSYNLVNGRPAHVSPLIREALRAWAPDDILVVSDAYAPGRSEERRVGKECRARGAPDHCNKSQKTKAH